MIRLRDSIEVKAPAERVFACLVQRLKDKQSYQAWHPDDMDIRWIRGEPVQEGSILYAEEYLHGDLHKFKFCITRIVPNRAIGYRSLFPLSLLVPGKFRVEPRRDDSCVFTAMAGLRISCCPFVRLHKKHERKIEAAEQHVKEEGLTSNGPSRWGGVDRAAGVKGCA
ncbi:MAG: SRPBCC family protein [Planctomycetota bacterium]|jgi:hypothetical protein